MENVAAASSAAAEKSPFPVHSFNSPCPSIRSVSSGPTPPLSSSSSCRSVSIYNPFDENIDERLRHSVYSPAFGTCGPITTCVRIPFCVAALNSIQILMLQPYFNNLSPNIILIQSFHFLVAVQYLEKSEVLNLNRNLLMQIVIV